MNIFVKNVNLSISLSLSTLRVAGFWAPDGLQGIKIVFYYCLGFVTFIYCVGLYVTIQTILLIKIWGDLSLMTAIGFLLFTNLAQVIKLVNLLYRKSYIQRIINDADMALRGEQTEEGKEIINGCNRETNWLLIFYLFLTGITGVGWSTSVSISKKQFPLPAWYPYDTTKSPAYELTFIHQMTAVFGAAAINIGKDMLVCALIAQCRCRLRLLAMSLKSLCRGLQVPKKIMLTPEQEEEVGSRLRSCVKEHQAALEAAVQLQTCFSEPTFTQFTVSLMIICVTAFQMVSETGNLVRFLSMTTFLMNMMYQVFLYCYQGHHLSEESSEVADAVYECPWYACSARLRRDMLIVMARTRRVARITAGGFTTLSLNSFTSIIKASYSLFTLLQQFTE